MQCVLAGHGLDASHARGHTALGHHLEQANVTRALHMGAAAELGGAADVQHAHHLTVFFAKQHHGAGFFGRFHVHQPRLGGGIAQNFSIDADFDFADFGVAHRRVVGKVKTGALGVHQAALLLHMAAQHLAQSLVHQVGDAVVAHGGGAQRRIHMGGDGIAHRQAAALDGAVVAEHIGLDLLRVCHLEQAVVTKHRALVTNLAAALAVEGRGGQHQHATLPGFQAADRRAICIHGYDFCRGREFVVTDKVVALAGIVQRLVHLELAGGSALGFLFFHGGMKTRLVHAQIALAANVG